MFELRVGEGPGEAGEGGTGQNLSLNPTRPGPAPPPASRRLSYNIHEPHEYAMFSLWGGGSHSALSPPLPLPGLPGEEAAVWGRGKEGAPDVEPDEGGGGTGG